MTPQAVFHPDQWDDIIRQGRLPEIQQWIRNNGIDLDDVARAPITLDTIDGQRVMRYTHYLSDETGGKYYDPAIKGAAREERTVPLLVEPPAWTRPEEQP